MLILQSNKTISKTKNKFNRFNIKKKYKTKIKIIKTHNPNLENKQFSNTSNKINNSTNSYNNKQGYCTSKIKIRKIISRVSNLISKKKIYSNKRITTQKYNRWWFNNKTF